MLRPGRAQSEQAHASLAAIPESPLDAAVRLLADPRRRIDLLSHLLADNLARCLEQLRPGVRAPTRAARTWSSSSTWAAPTCSCSSTTTATSAAQPSR